MRPRRHCAAQRRGPGGIFARCALLVRFAAAAMPLVSAALRLCRAPLALLLRVMLFPLAAFLPALRGPAANSAARGSFGQPAPEVPLAPCGRRFPAAKRKGERSQRRNRTLAARQQTRYFVANADGSAPRRTEGRGLRPQPGLGARLAGSPAGYRALKVAGRKAARFRYFFREPRSFF